MATISVSSRTDTDTAPASTETIRPIRSPEVAVRQKAATAAAVDGETRMIQHMIVSTAVAIPLLIAFWVGIVALAVSFTDEGFGAPLLMGAAVGVLAGVFWGTWMGFVSYSNTLDAERHLEGDNRNEIRHVGSPVST